MAGDALAHAVSDALDPIVYDGDFGVQWGFSGSGEGQFTFCLRPSTLRADSPWLLPEPDDDQAVDANHCIDLVMKSDSAGRISGFELEGDPLGELLQTKGRPELATQVRRLLGADALTAVPQLQALFRALFRRVTS